MFARNKKIKLPISDIFLSSPCLTLDQLMGYAENRISERECYEIEKHLVDCEFCSDALEGLNISEDKKNIRLHIAAMNKEIHKTVTSPSIHKHKWRIYYSLAAVFILTFVSILYFLNRKPSYEALYAEYFKPYPNTIPLIRGEEHAGKLESAMVEYESSNYKESLKLLQHLSENNPDNDTANFYAGISSLCLHDPQSAIAYLQNVVNNKKSDFIDQATWYLGLAYLNKNSIQEAKTSFTKLCIKAGPFSKKSNEILQRLQ